MANTQLEKKDISGGFHLHVHCLINGREATLIVDTGASHTILCKEAVKKYVNMEMLQDNPLPSTGVGGISYDTSLVKLTSLQIASVKDFSIEVAVIDISHVQESYKEAGNFPIDGILGCDYLVKHKCIIDLSKLKMKLL